METETVDCAEILGNQMKAKTKWKLKPRIKQNQMESKTWITKSVALMDRMALSRSLLSLENPILDCIVSCTVNW